MLASRWASQSEDGTAVHTPQKPLPATPRKSAPLSDPRLTGTRSDRAGSPATAMDSTSPRKRKRVMWNNRPCIICVPDESPGTRMPLSDTEVRELLGKWETQGYSTEGFRSDGCTETEDTQRTGTDHLFRPGSDSSYVVRTPDPKAWKDYVDWLLEEKLRALGVGGPDDKASSVSQAIDPPSRRSTPGLTTFSSHSRAMSIASPLSAISDFRGHAHRHSVFAFPQHGMPSPSSGGPALRSLSPLQHVGLHGAQRAVSPTFTRLMGATSPGLPESTSMRLSPLSAERTLSPPVHARQQSIVSSFTPALPPSGLPSAHRSGPVQADEDLVQRQIDNILSGIHVPVPSNHRHNISVSLEREIEEAENILERQESATEVLDHLAAGSSDVLPPFHEPAFSPQPDFAQFGQIGIPDQNMVPPPLPYGFDPTSRHFAAPLPQPPTVFNFGFGAAKPSFDFAGPMHVGQVASNSSAGFDPKTDGHARKASSVNFDAAAPAFKPRAFGTQQQPGNFQFSFAQEFKPGAKAFETSVPDQKALFGPISIDAEAKPVRRSKAIAITKPSPPASPAAIIAEPELLEDETGRLMQSTERQKRARKGGDEGDSVPLFADRPEDVDRAAEASLVVAESDAEETKSTDITGSMLPRVDSELSLAPSNTDGVSDDDAKDSVRPAPPSRSWSHVRQLSSLSALAKPFEFSMPSIFTQRASPKVVPAEPAHEAEDASISAVLTERPDLSPARVFSRDVAGDLEAASSVVSEPEKLQAAPHKVSAAELEREPSFDEIDAVMRQLNDEASESYVSDAISVVTVEDATPGAVDSGVDTLQDDIESSSERSVRMTTDAPRADSVLRGASPPNAASLAGRLLRNRNIEPSSDWSAGNATHDSSIQEILRTELRALVDPLKQQVENLHRAVATRNPAVSRSPSRPAQSDVVDSDADDEDDENEIVESRYISQPVSRKSARRFELMKAAAREAMVTQRPTFDPADVTDSLGLIHQRLDKMIGSGFELKDVQLAFEESLMKASSALLPLSSVTDSDDDRSPVFDAQRLLKLAENELDDLRSANTVKDGRISALEEERSDLRARLEAAEDAEARMTRRMQDLNAENAAQESTLEEYRAARTSWKHDAEGANQERKRLLNTVSDLEVELAEGSDVRRAMRARLERIQNDMTIAAEQLAMQKVLWTKKVEDAQSQTASYEMQLRSEQQMRVQLQEEAAKVGLFSSSTELLQAKLDHSLEANAALEQMLAALRKELDAKHAAHSHAQRELHDAQESSRLEVQRYQMVMQASIDAASIQSDTIKTGLESKLATVLDELASVRALSDSMQARHSTLLQEESDLRRSALLKVNEASSAALEGLRVRHAEDVATLKLQHDRSLMGHKEEQSRMATFWNERLGLAESRYEHAQERISHLEERLSLAQDAAQAAAQAAQLARSGTDSSSVKLQVPEKVSPQALRESICVLQEQLQEREARIESLTSQVAGFQPQLKQRDTELAWVRELLTLRSDDLTELISTLSQPSFDKAAARDAAVRIQAAIQMEAAEKERLISASAPHIPSPGTPIAMVRSVPPATSSLLATASPATAPPSPLASLATFASPKATQLAEAFGQWRAKGPPSSLRARAAWQQSRQQQSPQPTVQQSPLSSSTTVLQTATPKRPSSANSCLSEGGLMTPPASASSTFNPLSASGKFSLTMDSPSTPGSNALGIAAGPTKRPASMQDKRSSSSSSSMSSSLLRSSLTAAAAAAIGRAEEGRSRSVSRNSAISRKADHAPWTYDTGLDTPDATPLMAGSLDGTFERFVATDAGSGELEPLC